MKPLDLNQLIHELRKNIENLSDAELKEVIYALAKNIPPIGRHNFLDTVRHALIKNETSVANSGVSKSEMTPDDLFNRIEDYRECMEQGHFFDEEENYRAYDREDYSYYRRDYDDYFEEEKDFSVEDYVIEMENMLGDAEYFYVKGDYTTAYEAYRRLFEIMKNDEESGSNDYFIYGFSFEEAIGEEVFKMHLIIYYRLFYLHHINTNREVVFDLFCRRNDIYLSDIVDGDSLDMENMDRFVDDFILYLEGKSMDGLNAKRLVDALMVKGGINSLKKYAYENGQNVPPAFLVYYQEQKENNIPREELKQVILDGLGIIPEKYASREILGKGLIEMAMKENDEGLLLRGYSSAFYSNPTMTNLDAYLGFIYHKQLEREKGRLQLYIATKKHEDWLKELKGWFPYPDDVDTFTMHSSCASISTLIIADFVLNGIDEFMKHIDEKSILGFTNEKKYIPIILSLLFLTLAQKKDAQIINDLINYYCFNNEDGKYKNLKDLIISKAVRENKPDGKTLEAFNIAEKIAVNRVSHILNNKLRGGYGSACLLLTACAEAKQIYNQNGNRLITEIDTEFKRFSAFRRELKALTQKSRYLITVR